MTASGMKPSVRGIVIAGPGVVRSREAARRVRVSPIRAERTEAMSRIALRRRQAIVRVCAEAA